MIIVSPERVPSCKEAELMIRVLLDKGAVVLAWHCKKRMKERDISMAQIINCLAKGRVTENPFRIYENGGGYETRVEKITAGEWLRVAVCLRFNQTLLVITAIN